VLGWLHELWAMRHFKRVKIVEPSKRDTAINVSKLIGKPFPTVEDAFNWVVAHIRYVREDKDYWQTPFETLMRMAGDCEDGAILLASLFKQIVKEPWKVFVVVYERPAHAVVVYGRIWDWTNPNLKKIPSDWRCLYAFNFRHAYTTKANFERWLKCRR